ncbi:TorD/DmsD family molecular chaperone [Arcobacter sp.]|uniref:TorD/DmsD family molecular chaperone n=1 Tax=Arcobacter sp. TaxID=1872629 RepID=UPI003C7925C5
MKEQEINKARAIYYKIFSSFFVYTADANRYFQLLSLINLVKDSPLDGSSAEAFKNISNKLQKDSNISLVQEFDDIFNNPQTTQIRTTASFYAEQVESGKKRVQMLDFLAKTKIRRDEKKFSEYEDSIGFIFTVLSELTFLISEGEEQYKTVQHCIFADVLNEFVDDFSKAVYEHEKADIFKDVIVALVSFMELERLYLEVSKAKAKDIINNESKNEEISEEEKERRARNKAAKAAGAKQPKEDVFVTFDVEKDI